VGNRRSVPYPVNFNIAAYRVHIHIAFKVARFNTETVAAEFPKIKAQADHNGKLGMDAGKIPGNDCVESSDNCQFSAVFLGKITKCKKLDFNNITSCKYSNI
jgi:hypothetical protein